MLFEELVEQLTKEENSSSFDYIDDRTKAWVIETRIKAVVKAIVEDLTEREKILPW